MTIIKENGLFQSSYGDVVLYVCIPNYKELSAFDDKKEAAMRNLISMASYKGVEGYIIEFFRENGNEYLCAVVPR